MNNIDQNLGKENTPSQEEEHLTVEKIKINIENAFKKALVDVKLIQEGLPLSILPSFEKQKLLKGYSERVIADLDYMNYLRDFADPDVMKYIHSKLAELKSNDLAVLGDWIKHKI